MARYIDADKIITDAIKERKFFMTMLDASNQECVVKTIYKDLAEFIDAQPTADVVEVVRCKDCIHAVELDKHCEINRSAYRHCNMCRGEEETNVWHSYKKYRKDYSIVELDGFCDMGERKDT